ELLKLFLRKPEQIEKDRRRKGNSELTDEFTASPLLEGTDQFRRPTAHLLIQRKHLLGRKHRVQHLAELAVTLPCEFDWNDVPLLADHPREAAEATGREQFVVSQNVLQVRHT